MRVRVEISDHALVAGGSDRFSDLVCDIDEALEAAGVDSSGWEWTFEPDRAVTVIDLTLPAECSMLATRLLALAQGHSDPWRKGVSG